MASTNNTLIPDPGKFTFVYAGDEVDSGHTVLAYRNATHKYTISFADIDSTKNEDQGSGELIVKMGPVIALPIIRIVDDSGNVLIFSYDKENDVFSCSVGGGDDSGGGAVI